MPTPEEIKKMVEESRERGDFDRDWETRGTPPNPVADNDEDTEED
jgi:hypothetical protein